MTTSMMTKRMTLVDNDKDEYNDKKMTWRMTLVNNDKDKYKDNDKCDDDKDDAV